MAEIENLSISISASAVGAAKEVNSLASALNKLSAASKGAGNGMAPLAQRLNDIGNAARGVSANVGQKLNNLAAGLKSLQEVGKVGISSTLGKNIESINNALSKLNTNNLPKVERIATALKPLAEVQEIRISSTIAKEMGNIGAAAELLKDADFSGITNLANALKQFQGLENIKIKLPEISGTASDITGAADSASDGLGNLKNDADDYRDSAEQAERKTRSFSDRLKELVTPSEEVSEKLKSIASGAKKVGSAFIAVPKFFGGQMIKNIKESVKGMGKFLSSIKRVAMYRAIRTAMKEITQGFSEGIKNLYGWSSAVNGHFAASMNRIATSTQYLKNSLGAMASPLIESVAPAVDFIVDKFVDMFNIVNQFFARLTGQSTYTAAKKVAATWGDAAKSASGSAKEAVDELKRTILGFDEINKLNDNNTSSGSGGSGSISGTDYSGMFETRSISGTVSTFADQLKAAFNAANWQELGTLLGNKVNDIVNSVDFAGTGRKVGTAINAWFTTKYWTLDAINFTNIGSKIAEFLNNAIGKINFSTIGASLVQKMTIIGDAAIGFFTGFNWGQAAGKLSDFVKGLFNELTKWLNKYASGDMNWSSIGATIAEKLLDIIINIDYAGIANSMYEALSAAFEAGFVLLMGFFDGLAGRFKAAVNWDALSEGVQTAIEGVMAVLGLATGVLGAIFAFSGVNIPLGIGMMIAGGLAVGTSLSLMWGGLSDKIKENIESIKGIVSAASLVIGAILTFSGAHIGLGLGLMVAGATGLAGTIGANWNTIKQKLQGPIGAATALISGASLVLGIFALVGGMVPLGIGLILAGATGLATTVAANWDNMKEFGIKAIKKVKEGWESVKLAVNAAVSLVKQGWTSLTTWVGNIAAKGVSLVKQGWTSLTTWVGNIAAKGVSLVKQGWTSLTTWVGNIAAKGVSLVKQGWTSLTTWVGNIAARGVSLVRDGWNNLVDWVKSFGENFIEVFVGFKFKNNLKEITSNVGQKAQQTYQGLSQSGGVTNFMGNLLGALGGKQEDLNVNLTVNAVPGNGLSRNSAYGGGLMLNPIADVLANVIVNAKTAWSNSWGGIKSYLGLNNLNAEVTISAIGKWGYWGYQMLSYLGINNLDTDVSVGVKKDWWGTALDALNLKNLSTTISVGLKTVNNSVSLTGGGGGTWTLQTKAKGGIFAGGLWSDIPQYARGTANAHGTMFLAGEAGPEIVGHVGGRTEVLNKSQLAATMYAAVQAAMAPASANFANAAAYMYQGAQGYGEEDMEALMELVRAGSEATQRQNDLLRQQNEYLRQINDKEFTAEWSTSGLAKAQQRANRRAGVTVIPVGT